jgi:hypothetical protein
MTVFIGYCLQNRILFLFHPIFSVKLQTFFHLLLHFCLRQQLFFNKLGQNLFEARNFLLISLIYLQFRNLVNQSVS